MYAYCIYTHTRVVIQIVCAIYMNGKSHISEKKVNTHILREFVYFVLLQYYLYVYYITYILTILGIYYISNYINSSISNYF